MRIITGSKRGKKLVTLEGEQVRPTTDRVKESLFNILQFQLEGRKFLDLFAGSGQIGLEALSRGAALCVFVDSAKESIRVVEQTVTDPETEEESQVLTTGVFVLVGQQAEFKPVTVVEQMEEFALVVPADGVSDSEALRAGDQIILSSVELTDGAVILDS